jgi:CO/xanthine dehydrogenase Mo-binding subunit
MLSYFCIFPLFFWHQSPSWSIFFRPDGSIYSASADKSLTIFGSCYTMPETTTIKITYAIPATSQGKNMTNREYKYLGKPHKLVEGMEKVTGRAQFTADLNLPGLLHARLVLSPFAHARIVEIDKSAAAELPGVVAVLAAEDLITRDRMITTRNNAILAKERVLWCGQPVVAVVAETEQQAEDAAELVFVDYEPLPAVANIAQAIRPDTPTIWPHGLPDENAELTAVHGATEEEAAAGQKTNNVHTENSWTRGDITQGFAAADLILENRFTLEMLHQGYLEPHASIATPDPLGRGVTLYTATQGQFIVRDEVSRFLNLPKRQVRVVPMTFGGGFGAKYGILDPLAAAVALTLNRPVRVLLSRSADFLTTTPAPAITIELKTGVQQDGTLTALQAKVWLDNGIFSFTLGGIVATLLGGAYRWPHLHIECHEVNTHKPQVGAYRAPGAPQAFFALEAHIDEMARRLELDPLEFRLQNGVEGGDLTGTGREWPPLGFKQCLERMRAHPRWQNRETGPHEGIGLAAGGWPSFMTPASAICRVDSDGTVNLHIGTSDISGVNSSFVLVAAEVLGVSPEEVAIVPGDTSSNPFAPGSGGSQTTYSVAGAIRRAAEAAKERLLAIAMDEFEAAAEDIEFADSHAQVKGVPDKRISIARLASIAQSKRGGPGPIVGEGSAAVEKNAPGFVVHLAKVHVDPETGRVTVLDYIAVQDVGFALNPLLVHGQIHGAVAQGIGMALYEALQYDESGQLLTGSFTDYALPHADDVPPIETILVENPSPLGPFGARGIGEPPITAPAAAIANAIRDATGKRLTQLPLRPEIVWQALQDG